MAQICEEDHFSWQIGVFCQNEDSRIAHCLASIQAAIHGRNALVTVIINGSTDDSLAQARAAAARIHAPVRIFTIPVADKSNAINRFLFDPSLHVAADLYFCVDGYVTIAPGALGATEGKLSSRPEALAATGIAGNGRTEPRSARRTVEVGGVMHGQFYCLTARMVQRMAAGRMQIPVGLYRGDGLLGSMAAHDLDPVERRWDNRLLIGVAEAVFLIEPLSVFRVRDLRRQFRRKIRQMRGRVENAAIREIVHTQGFAALPHFADDMIRKFLSVHPIPPVSLIERPFMELALRHHRAARPPEEDQLEPTRVL